MIDNFSEKIVESIDTSDSNTVINNNLDLI
jgi:hypothetical protein